MEQLQTLDGIETFRNHCIIAAEEGKAKWKQSLKKPPELQKRNKYTPTHPAAHSIELRMH
jgi:hypothetical protein